MPIVEHVQRHFNIPSSGSGRRRFCWAQLVWRKPFEDDGHDAMPLQLEAMPKAATLCLPVFRVLA
jgi:hypothetical protein